MGEGGLKDLFRPRFITDIGSVIVDKAMVNCGFISVESGGWVSSLTSSSRRRTRNLMTHDASATFVDCVAGGGGMRWAALAYWRGVQAGDPMTDDNGERSLARNAFGFVVAEDDS